MCNAYASLQAERCEGGKFIRRNSTVCTLQAWKTVQVWVQTKPTQADVYPAPPPPNNKKEGGGRKHGPKAACKKYTCERLLS